MPFDTKFRTISHPHIFYYNDRMEPHMFDNYIHYVFAFEFNHVGFILINKCYIVLMLYYDSCCINDSLCRTCGAYLVQMKSGICPLLG